MSVIEPGPKHSFSLTQPCFIVARDPALHFGGSAPAAKGFGAALREIEHPDLFRHIEEFIAEEEPNFVESFSLAIPNTDSLIALGRFRVEIEHSEQLEHALLFERESIEDEDPRFMDIAILLNNIMRIEKKVRRLLAAGSETPYAEKRERAKAKFLLRSYWDLLHRLCASEAGRARHRSTDRVRHIIEALRSRIASVSVILRPNDPDGSAARNIDHLFEFLTCGDPVDWESIRMLVPAAIEEVTAIIAKSTAPDSRVLLRPEHLDEEFRRAAAVHIDAFIALRSRVNTASPSTRNTSSGTPAMDSSLGSSSTSIPRGDAVQSGGLLGGSSASALRHGGVLASTATGAATARGHSASDSPTLVVNEGQMTVEFKGKVAHFDGGSHELFILFKMLAEGKSEFVHRDQFTKDGAPWESAFLDNERLGRAVKRLRRHLRKYESSELDELAEMIEVSTLHDVVRVRLDQSERDQEHIARRKRKGRRNSARKGPGRPRKKRKPGAVSETSSSTSKRT
jgi:hypothetical protein